MPRRCRAAGAGIARSGAGDDIAGVLNLLAGCRGGGTDEQVAADAWGLLAAQHPSRGAGAAGQVIPAAGFALGAAGGAAVIRGGPDNRYLLAAHARLDGRATLAAQLAAPDDESDAALILAAWLRWGVSAPQHLYGDYAFAMWDTRDRRLWLVRDALGQYPLFFLRDGSAFASRADAFAALDPRHGRPCVEALAAYLAYVTDRAASHYAGVDRVRPGEMVTIADAGVSRRTWWQPSLAPVRVRNPADRIATCRALLETAVAARVGGAGIIATHLSSGLDSSVVTALAARHAPVHAFTAIPQSTAGADGRLVDESEYAAMAAAALPGVVHHNITDTADPIGQLSDGARLYQHPVPNPHNHGWGAAINDAARDEGAQLLLIGQTGNYTFSMGGARFRAARRIAREMLGRSRQAMPAFPLLARDALALTESDPAPQGAAERRLHFLQRLDPGAYFAGVTAHWGFAACDPFADRRLTEFSLTIPDAALAALGDRGLGRPVAAQLLPAAFVANRARGYQSVDWIARLRLHAGAASRLIARGRDHDALTRLIDFDALAAAVARLEQLAAPTAADERLYRVDVPRALAGIAFFDSLHTPDTALSHAEPMAWQGARL